MLLSQTAEYALRAMASLAFEQPEGPSRAHDLSKSTGIPPHYLSKILRRLVTAGLLTSRKGQGGGFSLSRLPEEISFEEILLAVDAYPKQGRCGLSNAIHHWASTTTLATVSSTPLPEGSRDR
jgi:Rrf2 family protein